MQKYPLHNHVKIIKILIQSFLNLFLYTKPRMRHIEIDWASSVMLGPLLLTWFNFNPSMDK